MFSVDSVLAALALEPVAADRYRAGSVGTGGPVVHGGQLLAQTLIAAQQGQDGKRVKTLHTVFARAARPDAPLEIAVDRVHSGRSLATSLVSISQGERLCVQSQVMLSADEPDFIHHADTHPAPPALPADQVDPAESAGAWQIRIAGDVDVNDPEAVGPAELDVWTRWPGAPDDEVLGAALLAFSTDSFLIATAMRPHPGVGQALAHRSISTGVLSHTITFHAPVPAREWLLLSHRSSFAGHGRSYGRGDAYRGGRGLVASFVQDNMIRAMAASGRHL
ncbi:acyl-CoA thioesterase II [Frankia sp. EI5c]|uniref:acyl-CoA thioesterase n=1 Tax=Frankia sp. EI5c TaxID=683316 RepID=UPI0007C3A1A2|nr:acyl-CoA thioesterase domain-containing protein [Frankia sp. EI5c]OAA18919.1 acyl-CoA thioesterase II [Frankia sp. EI5c]